MNDFKSGDKVIFHDPAYPDPVYLTLERRWSVRDEYWVVVEDDKRAYLETFMKPDIKRKIFKEELDLILKEQSDDI